MVVCGVCARRKIPLSLQNWHMTMYYAPWIISNKQIEVRSTSCRSQLASRPLPPHQSHVDRPFKQRLHPVLTIPLTPRLQPRRAPCLIVPPRIGGSGTRALEHVARLRRGVRLDVVHVDLDVPPRPAHGLPRHGPVQVAPYLPVRVPGAALFGDRGWSLWWGCVAWRGY